MEIESENSTWVARIGHADAQSLVALRDIDDLKIAIGDEFWVRGSFAGVTDEDRAVITHRLLCVPGMERFWLKGELLVPWGKQVPLARLPKIEWQNLHSQVELARPVAGFAGKSNQRLGIRLVRKTSKFSNAANEPCAILCGLQQWVEYASSAPQVRLSSLKFAVNEKSDVVVIGTPLPSVAAQQFCLFENVAIPVGWSWVPEVSPQTLVECLNVPNDSIAVLFTDGTWNQIAKSHFSKATRSAIRLSVGGQNP